MIQGNFEEPFYLDLCLMYSVKIHLQKLCVELYPGRFILIIDVL